MPYVQPLAPGFRYGLGAIAGGGATGQLVRLTGDNVFSVNADPAKRSFGLLEKTTKDGELGGVPPPATNSPATRRPANSR